MSIPSRMEIRTWLLRLEDKEIRAKKSEYSAMEWEDIRMFLNTEHKLYNSEPEKGKTPYPLTTAGEHSLRIDRLQAERAA